MSRLNVREFEASPDASKPLLTAVGQQLGVIPNLFRLIGNSPDTLAGYLGLSGALANTLDAATRERIALAVAQVNGCDYCLSAHSYLALNVAKLDAEEVNRNRRGGSKDARANAAVRFAAKVTETRGHIGDADLSEVRLAGFSDSEIVEIVAIVAQNCFTNFLNEVAKTDIDFPGVRAADVA